MLVTVTLLYDMRPWRAGDDIHVPQELADALLRNGEARDLRPFVEPNQSAVQSRAAEPPRRPILSRRRIHEKRA